ncbi:MAG: o-succinylbenzoate--CoA ligase [Anaerolineae bacterium]|jgi:O-succinylbenzoic acid--CoA ligase|nr:o-succinylbenzoate--CoA ligase [Anaerolineae bacterium]
MLDWLFHSTQANPQNIALIYRDQKWTYAELNAQVDTLCQALSEYGVKQDQLIGVLMPNCPEYVLLIHALIRVGAVIVPLNTRLTAHELRYQVEKADCSCVIYRVETAETAQHLTQPLIAIESLIDHTTASFMPQMIDFDRLHAIVFTSGTTGNPKGAMLTYGNHFYSATASAFRLGTLPEDRWALCLPLYHVGGLNIVLRCCLYGTAVVLYQGFDPQTILADLTQHQITLISLVPTMLTRLLDANGDQMLMHSLRLILLGGAAASIELVARCQSLGLPISTTYGLTEADSQVATQTPSHTVDKPGSVGKGMPWTTITVIGEEHTPLPKGEIGEIVVSGHTVMAGYYRDPEATAKTLRHGKLYTGDLGYFDQDGDLWLVQRRSDLIVTGGENVYPVEVEQRLKQHSAVRDACVVGVADPQWGQQVGAAIILHKSVTPEELMSFCRETLAGYKIPRVFKFVDAFPLTGSGKIERKAVQTLFKD